MNKQAKTPKTSRGVYIKFTLIMIASALTGALISIFLLGREDGLMQLAQQAGNCLTQAGLWLLALGLVPCAVAHGLYLAGQKAAARADEDDDAFETANRRLSLSMVFSAVAMPWVMLTSCLAVPAVTLWESAVPALAVVPLMIAELAWSYGLQAAVVRAEQRLAPEKRGNVFDVRFQKDWYDSCDEAERQRIGQAAYTSYTVTSYSCLFVWVVLVVLNILVPIGPLPIIAVFIPWALGQFTYLGQCIRMETPKRSR